MLRTVIYRASWVVVLMAAALIGWGLFLPTKGADPVILIGYGCVFAVLSFIGFFGQKQITGEVQPLSKKWKRLLIALLLLSATFVFWYFTASSHFAKNVNIRMLLFLSTIGSFILALGFAITAFYKK